MRGASSLGGRQSLDTICFTLKPIELLIMRCVQGTKFGKDLREGEPAMETRILESSINKICSLLAVGFGDAGAEVGCMR